MARRLFEHIWDEHLSPLQKELQPIGRDGLPVPVHTLKREPKRLQDIKVYQKTRIAIWRDNETMLVVRNCLLTDQPFAPTLAKNAAFTIMNAGMYMLDCNVFGKTDAAIAETLTYGSGRCRNRKIKSLHWKLGNTARVATHSKCESDTKVRAVYRRVDSGAVGRVGFTPVPLAYDLFWSIRIAR